MSLLQNTDENLTQKITYDAKRILTDCPWEHTVSSILNYGADTETTKTNDTTGGYPPVGDWINMMKATGGGIAIAWYHDDMQSFVEYTVLDPVDNTDKAFTRIIIDENHFQNTTTGECTLQTDHFPIYKQTGNPFADNDYGECTPLAATITEIKKSLSLTEQQEFPLDAHQRESVNPFTHCNPAKTWPEITQFTPVTDPAEKIIRQVPWIKLRNTFLSYAAANDPIDFMPTEEQWLNLLDVTAGQILIGWYDPEDNSIKQTTYYDFQSTPDDNGAGLKLHVPHSESKSIDYATQESMGVPVKKKVMRSNINELEYLPIALSVYSTGILADCE